MIGVTSRLHSKSTLRLKACKRLISEIDRCRDQEVTP